MTFYARAMSCLLVVFAMTAGILALAGGPLVPVWGVAVLALIELLRRSYPASLALALAIGTFFAIELLLLRATPFLGVGSSLPNLVGWTTFSFFVGVLGLVRPKPAELVRSRVWLALASATGVVVFVVGIALAQVIPGALRLSWAMNGDAVNAMGFARRMLVDGGIDPTSTPQPTPLPFAMAAASIEGGRSSVPIGELLEHDVARTAQVWVFVIALSCLLVGVIVARSVGTASLRWSVPVVALASLTFLSWYVIGVQFDFGFMNSGFGILLLLAAWLAYAGGEDHPLAVLSALFVVALALLAVWSPLVICIVGLGLVTVVRDRALITRARRLSLMPPVLALVVLAAYAVTVTLPTFVTQSDALGDNGGFPPIGPGSTLVITTIVLLVAALTAQSGAARTPAGAIAVVIGFAVGLGYLLLQRQDADFGWGYYPAKFAWTSSVVIVAIILALSAQLVSVRPFGRAWKPVVTVLMGAVAASLLWGPVAPRAQFPLLGIARGDETQVRATEAVFDLAGPQNGKDLLWRTDIGDFWPNTWLLQIDQLANDPVKIYATVPLLSADQVCAIVGELGPESVIHTSDPAAHADLQATCPNAQYEIVEGEY